MPREPGFYWVRTLEDWTIGEWINGRSPDGRDNRWRLPGYSFHEADHVFQEIDERRIERMRKRTWRNDRNGRLANTRP
jgi:hypothetical protein